MAKRKPIYSKYQQWCDAGKPYFTGVKLALQVDGFHHLKRTLHAKDSPYNRQKLDGFLATHMSTVPAEQLKAEDLQQVATTEAAEKKKTKRGLPPKVVTLSTGAAVSIDNAVSRMGPAIPAAWSDSKLALPEFAELPDVLKKARIENNERRKRASQLHDQICEWSLQPSGAAMKTIHLRDALRLMGEIGPNEQPAPFRYAGFTHNRKTGNGGERIEIPEAVLLTEAALANPRSMRVREQSRAAKATNPSAKHRPGAHFRSATRDLLLPTGEKHRVIVWLMTEFNGMRVIHGSGGYSSTATTTANGTAPTSLDDRILRRDVCAEIVQLMDLVTASYDAEREWKLNKTVPLQDDDLRAQYQRLDLYELKTVLVDRLSPRVSYWRKQCKLRDGDALVEANLRLTEAVHEKMIVEDLIISKRKERENLAAAERLKVVAKPKRKR